MINTYSYQFFSKCPNNGKVINYKLTITAEFMIQVEHIMLACSLYESAFHEQIAEALYKRFGGKVKLEAHHHGVDISTAIGDIWHQPKAVVFTEPTAE